jgi:dihydroorotase
VAGGYGTIVVMANTKPVIDTLELATSIYMRSQELGLVDVYPVLSLTRQMAGTDCSHLKDLVVNDSPDFPVRMLSEDGKDVVDDQVFEEVMQEANRLELPVSCHCEAGGGLSNRSKEQGDSRSVWSRIDENEGTRRALNLGQKTGAHVHIAHVSTREAIAMVRQAKALNGSVNNSGNDSVTCEVTPHHLALTEEDARLLGEESYGRVNPPLRTSKDIQQLIQALVDGTVDAIATDHAPHTAEEKAMGTPGFIGLETAFSVCYEQLVRTGHISLSKLSALLSANPAKILRLADRGCIKSGMVADLVLLDVRGNTVVTPQKLHSRSKNTPFMGRSLPAQILMTIHRGVIVYQNTR